jgi:hypothetical protein
MNQKRIHLYGMRHVNQFGKYMKKKGIKIDNEYGIA